MRRCFETSESRSNIGRTNQAKHIGKRMMDCLEHFTRRLKERKVRIMYLLGCCILMIALVNVLRSSSVMTPMQPPAPRYEKGHDENWILSYKRLPGNRVVESRDATKLNTNRSLISIHFPNIFHDNRVPQPRGDNGDMRDPYTTRLWAGSSGIPKYDIEKEMSTDVKISEIEMKTTPTDNNLIINFLLNESTHRFNIDNFLSVWSVVKYLQPKRVIFHCHVMPVDDTWWRQTLRITPNNNEMVVLNVTSVNGKIENDAWRFNVLRRYGGMVVSPNVIFLRSIPQLRNTDILIDNSTLPVSVVYVRNNERTSQTIDTVYDTIKSGRHSDLHQIIQRQDKTISLNMLGNSDIYCLANTSLPMNVSQWESKTLVKIDISYSAYESPVTVDRLASETTQWAAIARQTLFGSPEIVNAIVPNTYHYLWTESKVRDLSMMEVMSIKSIFHFAKPDKIYFHTKVLPSGKMWDDISRIPVFDLRLMDTFRVLNCDTKFDIIREKGGVFIDFNVIITQDIHLFRLGYVQSWNKLDQNLTVCVNYTNKMTIRSYGEVLQNEICPSILMSCKGKVCPSYAVIYPHVRSDDSFNSNDILLDSTFILINDIGDVDKTSLNTRNGSTGYLARYVLYGETNIFGEESTFKVPNIIHYIWFGNETEFCFHSFLCVYSAFINQKPDKIYFHYEILPTGTWWQALTFAVTLTLIHTTPSSTVFGQPVTIVEHQSDIARLIILQKYGGIYLDIDIFVINSLDPLRTHSFVMAEEQPYVLGNGIILAEKNSTFLKLYLKSYRSFNDSLWGYNSVVVPYKLMLHNRDLIHLGPHDRILKPDWSTCLNDIWYPKSMYYWWDNYVVHLYCKSNVAKYLPFMDTLIYSDRFATSTFGQIAQTVYETFKKSIRK